MGKSFTTPAIKAFGAICLGAAIAMLYAKSNIEFDHAAMSPATSRPDAAAMPREFAVPASPSPASSSDLELAISDLPVKVGSAHGFVFDTDKNGSGALPIHVKFPVGSTSKITLLHSMGNDAAIEGEFLMLKGLRPNAQYRLDAGLGYFDYSSAAKQTDPTHAKTSRIFWWTARGSSRACDADCALLLDKPRLLALGTEGSPQRYATEFIGKTDGTDIGLLALGFFLGSTGLALGLKLGAQKGASALAPARGKLRLE